MRICEITLKKTKSVPPPGEKEGQKRPDLLHRKIEVPELKSTIRLRVSTAGLQILKETGGLVKFLEQRVDKKLSRKLLALKKQLLEKGVIKAVEAEAPKEEAAKEEAPKEEAATEEAAKEEAAKEEAAKEEAPKEAAAKEEAPKEKAAKEEAPKKGAAKEEAPKVETAKEDIPKEKAPKEKAAKEEAPKEAKAPAEAKD